MSKNLLDRLKIYLPSWSPEEEILTEEEIYFSLERIKDLYLSSNNPYQKTQILERLNKLHSKTKSIVFNPEIAKDIRLRKKLSLRALQDIIGIDRRRISAFENGRIYPGEKGGAKKYWSWLKSEGYNPRSL